jgi:geranylgeranyl reductase family protein
MVSIGTSKEEHRADVLVVGAGPAGSAAAMMLARTGRAVTLVDRCAFPREKVCGDALIPDALNALEHLGVKDVVLRGSRHLDGVRVFAPNGRAVDVDGECASIPRLVLDELLRAEAVRAGVRFLSGTHVTGPLLDGERVVGAQIGESRVRADITLLATGAAAEPLKRFGVCQRIMPSASAARIFVRTDERFARDFSHLCIAYDAAVCPGYGWIFPAPDATFNIGVCYFYDAKALPPERNVRRLLAKFLDRFPLARETMRHSVHATELRGAPLRTALCGAALSRPGLLVIGEAAGLTYSLSGEGIGKALESGIIAADTIAAFSAVTPSSADVIANQYATRLRERFAPRFRAYRLAQDWLASPRFANLLARRARRSAFVRRELSALFQETTDPGRLFSVAGILRSLVS